VVPRLGATVKNVFPHPQAATGTPGATDKLSLLDIVQQRLTREESPSSSLQASRLPKLSKSLQKRLISQNTQERSDIPGHTLSSCCDMRNAGFTCCYKRSRKDGAPLVNSMPFTSIVLTTTTSIIFAFVYVHKSSSPYTAPPLDLPIPRPRLIQQYTSARRNKNR
jgi:hypothetical protein